MAERNYVITIKNDTKQEQSAVAGNSTNEPTKTEGEKKLDRGMKSIKGIVCYATAKNLINTAVNYRINTISLRTGASEYEEKVRFGKQCADFGLGIAEGVVGGLLATGGNPIGAVVGGVVSATSSLISYSQRQNTINLERNLENISNSMLIRRSGVGGSR